MLGLAHGHVAIADYHPDWPAAFATEAARIHAVLPGIAVEHIGSTSVPGLPAKPVLDLMLGYAGDLAPVIATLVSLGYQHYGEHGIPGREFFTGDAAGQRTHHIHLVRQGSEFWLRHLAFRDALRRDDKLRDGYGALKRELALRHSDDVSGYTDAKSDFIAGVLAQRS